MSETPETLIAATAENETPARTVYDFTNREIPRIYLPFLVSEKVSVFVRKDGTCFDIDALSKFSMDNYFRRTFGVMPLDAKFKEVCVLNISGSGLVSVRANFFRAEYSYRERAYLTENYGRTSAKNTYSMIHDICKFSDIYAPFLMTETSVAIQAAIVEVVKSEQIVRDDSR